MFSVKSPRVLYKDNALSFSSVILSEPRASRRTFHLATTEQHHSTFGVNDLPRAVLKTMRSENRRMQSLLFAATLAVLAACSPPSAHAAPPPADTPLAPWIEWDRTTDHVVSAPGDRGAAYPRARQLSNGEILLAYHAGESVGDFGNRVVLRHSRDGGRTWYRTQEIDGPNERGFWGFCNPDFLELAPGRLLLVSAARARAAPFSRDIPLSECQRGGLRVRFSDDSGHTWGPPRLLAAGRGRLWEPSVVRLPGGELQIFYACESPLILSGGANQGIECIRSTDDGRTWTNPVLVTAERGCRNGMPATLALSNGHVLCGQEVVGMATSPWLVDTLHGVVQNFRLAQDRYDFGAAPFLARAPDGGTLLAFHSQYKQTPAFKLLNGSWLFSDICVQRGDAGARNFGPASNPWPMVADQTGAFFPSLLVLRDGAVVALASFISVQPDHSTRTVVRWIKGHLTTPNPPAG